MNPTPLSDDSLDGLLSEFFHAELRRPWPASPVPPAAHPVPRNRPAPASGHDSGSRARYTLAASVALLLGTCWTLSNGLRPGERSGTTNTAPANTVNLNVIGASNPDALKELRKDHAEKGTRTNPFDPTQVDPFK